MIKYWFWDVPIKAIHMWFVDVVWANFGWAALIGFCAFLLPMIRDAIRGAPSETLSQWRAHPMSSFYEYATAGEGAIWLFGAITIGYIVCALFFAPYQIHSEQLEALESARVELQAAAKASQDREPRLSGRIVTTFFADIYDLNDTHKTTMVAVYVFVKNTGEPSIAHSWIMTIKVPGYDPFTGKPTYFDAEGAAHIASTFPQKQVRVFDRERQIARVTNQPIVKGGAVSGWYVTSCDQIPYEKFDVKTVKLELEFTDVNDNKHVCIESKGETIPDDVQIQMSGDL